MDANARLYLMVSAPWLMQAVGIGWIYGAGVGKVGNVFLIHSAEVPQLGAGCLACCRLSVRPLVTGPCLPSVFLCCV